MVNIIRKLQQVVSQSVLDCVNRKENALPQWFFMKDIIVFYFIKQNLEIKTQ
jgi:hypothetical protein